LTLPLQNEDNPGAKRIHHSLKNQTSVPSGTSLAGQTHVAETTISTRSRPRRASGSLAKIGTIHVLLVEDNIISQKLLKKQLVRAGCSVVTANDGVEAIEYLLKHTSNNPLGATENEGNNSVRVELLLMGK
jgi:hypothetical protein